MTWEERMVAARAAVGEICIASGYPIMSDAAVQKIAQAVAPEYFRERSSTSTYARYRDIDKRRAYMRDLMRKKRAKARDGGQ